MVRTPTKEDYCPKCNGILFRGIWNSKIGKVVDWCPTCNPDGIKDCVIHEGEMMKPRTSMWRKFNLLQLLMVSCFIIVVVWVCLLQQKVDKLIADQMFIADGGIVEQMRTVAETTFKSIGDLRDFTIQQHNATLQLIRLNREAIDIVNNKIVDPNLLPKLVKKITPSIVKIEVHPGFDEWTGEEMGWSGSGVFVAPDLILTVGHVVDRVMIEQNADPEYIWKVGLPVVVKLVDGMELKVVDVYQADHNLTDLGLLRVEFPNDVNKPTPLTFGKVNVGEQVFAIGEPYGLFPSVTSGIVSAIDVNDPEDFFGKANLLQTDCPINPGNSGCPLINMGGEIIGICVGAIRPADGIGFCVPADICKWVIELYNAECVFKRECEK
jgi:S1-C subfamily serine protease